MEQTILDYGPPPLTEQAADAALDAIDFIAAAVRGFEVNYFRMAMLEHVPRGAAMRK